jgi:hypothetical protein
MTNWKRVLLAGALPLAVAVSVPGWSGAQGVQLTLAVADGPVPVGAGELPPLLLQLRNHGPDTLLFVWEAIGHPDIEIDGVWHVQTWAGSCCSAPRRIPPGGTSDWFPLRVVAALTFVPGVIPARAIDVKPGRHSIRVRSVSRARFYLGVGPTRLVLTSNIVAIDVPGPAPLVAMQPTTPPACDPGPGRRSATIYGAVERAGRLAQATDGGWLLRLEPHEHGWTLLLSTADRPAEDLSRLTPPWHSAVNPRDIEGWHFRNAGNTGPNDGSVNAPGAHREFIFSPLVGREIEYRGSATPVGDVEKVRAFGRGWLFIESYRLTPPQQGSRAAIESLSFWVCLSWPAG